MPSDPNEFFANEQGSSGLDKPLDRVIDHADLIGSGYTPHEDIDKHIEQMHDWATRYVTINRTQLIYLNGVSDTTWTSLNASSHVTKNTFAVHLYVRAKDASSAAHDTYVAIRYPEDTNKIMQVNAHYINGKENFGNGTVKCSDTQKIEYMVEASGANSFFGNIYLIGYHEYIYKPFKE